MDSWEVIKNSIEREVPNTLHSASPKCNILYNYIAHYQNQQSDIGGIIH